MFIAGSVQEDGSLNNGNLSIPWQQWFGNAATAIKTRLLNGGDMAVLGPYSAATNITADLYGTPDTRPSTWGYTEFVDVPIQVFPHPGRGGDGDVRILRVYGNVYIMPEGHRDTVAGPFPDPKGYAAMLWGFLTTAPGGSSRVTLSADDCLSFYQVGLDVVPQHFEFDFSLGQGVTPGQPTMGVLSADNVLVCRGWRRF